MKKIISALAVLLAATAASAEFEGVLDMKFTSPQTAGTAKVFLSKKGMRNETQLQAHGMAIKTVTLFLKNKPGVIYQVREDQKTYSEIDLAGAAKAAKTPGETYTVKDLGEETLQGYRCRHVLLTTARGAETELWSNRDIMDYGSYAAAHSSDRGSGTDAGFLKALKDAGADGFPVKSIHRGKKGGEGITMELVKAEAKALPSSLFEIPAGYKKAAGPGGTMPPEAQKAMEEQMKSMPADKREMMEKMLKNHSFK